MKPEFRERDRLGFAFMTNDISSERRVEVSVGKIATMMREVKQAGGRIAFVAGPVVVHTGGVEHFCALMQRGYVDVLLAGNALAVHDIELAFFGTSLGVDLALGNPVQDQQRARAINTSSAQAYRAAVDQNVLVRPDNLNAFARTCASSAGSIRDDGPLPDDDGPDRGAGPGAEALADDLVLVLGRCCTHWRR